MSVTPSTEVPRDVTAERVGEFLSDQAVPVVDGGGAKAFARRLARHRQARRSLRWFTLGASATCALVLVGLVSLRLGRKEPIPTALSYRVDNHDAPPDGFIDVPRASESMVAFSDGSKIRMAEQTRGRVSEVSHRGARFALDEGRLSVDIVPRNQARWVIEAGPFRVNVHGTTFSVAWSPITQVFDVRLANGAISVASPLAEPEIQMHGGQSLRVSLRDQTINLENTLLKEHPASKTPATHPFSPTVAPPSSEEIRWSHRGWATQLSRGEAAQVIADANRRGFASVLNRADSEDLWALANAARYSRRYQLASEALLAQRKRFPSTEQAREAAFLLGRLHDEDPDGPASAIGWYDRYLSEAREGASASDALGRKMALLQRWNRPTEAVSVAHDYLRRFPRGTYAKAARALLRSPGARQ